MWNKYMNWWTEAIVSDGAGETITELDPNIYENNSVHVQKHSVCIWISDISGLKCHTNFKNVLLILLLWVHYTKIWWLFLSLRKPYEWKSLTLGTSEWP